MRTNQQLTSTLRPNGEVEIVLVESLIPDPDDDEIVVEMVAAPLNPTDMALLFAFADASTARCVTRDQRTITVVKMSNESANAQRKRWNKAMPVGTEGAGRVVSTGPSKEAQVLQGKLVAIWGGGMYATASCALPTPCSCPMMSQQPKAQPPL